MKGSVRLTFRKLTLERSREMALNNDEARQAAREFAEVGGQTIMAAAQLLRWDSRHPDIFVINEMKYAKQRMDAAWENFLAEAMD